jgi:hypothetical protein
MNTVCGTNCPIWLGIIFIIVISVIIIFNFIIKPKNTTTVKKMTSNELIPFTFTFSGDDYVDIYLDDVHVGNYPYRNTFELYRINMKAHSGSILKVVVTNTGGVGGIIGSMKIGNNPPTYSGSVMNPWALVSDRPVKALEYSRRNASGTDKELTSKGAKWMWDETGEQTVETITWTYVF